MNLQTDKKKYIKIFQNKKYIYNSNKIFTNKKLTDKIHNTNIKFYKTKKIDY